MDYAPVCWCGNKDLIFFSASYFKCAVCNTLVSKICPPENSRLPDDEEGFYGHNYWFAHQKEDLRLPDIIQRARQDLPERCVHWMRTLLKYRLPPAHALELGSAHGAFVAMLKWAGYEATGLELSSWVVDFARQTFNVPMLLGEVEDQPIEPGSLDIIALMDVIEHLRDPLATISHCLSLLGPEGILIMQTPRYPEEKSYDEMVVQGDRFLELLRPNEHIHLFSCSSIREFFRRQGVNHLAFEPAIFSAYDMFLIASRAPLHPYLPEESEKSLTATPGGRLVQALLDLDRQRQQVFQKYDEAEKDRANRLEQIHVLTDQVQALTRLLQEPLWAKIWRKLSSMIKTLI